MDDQSEPDKHAAMPADKAQPGKPAVPPDDKTAADMAKSTPDAAPLPSKAAWSFAIAVTLGLWSYGLFVYTRIPHDFRAMMVVPETCSLLGFFPLVFIWMAQSPRPQATRIATWLSAALWIGSIVLAFAIKTSSAFLPIPDALLLVGFLPLLFLWRWSWPWLIIGAFDILIGQLLLVVSVLPDDVFPPNLITGKAHLKEFHEPLIWMTIGYATWGYGAVRMTKNIALWVKRKLKRS